MKVAILTEGGKNIGFGHLTRCVSLCEAFKEKQIYPEFIVNGDKSIKSVLKNHQYRLFDWNKHRNKLFRMIKNTDICVIDSYLADLGLYESLCELSKMPIYLDDNKRLDYPCGIVLNGNIHAKSLGYPKKKGVKYLLGLKYAPIRKAFWNVPEKIIKKDVQSIMITVGGNDIRNLTPKILKFLNENYPKIIKNVVINSYPKEKNEIKRLRGNYVNLIFEPGAEEMKQGMLDSDIAVACGGQTLYELARLGVPTVAFSVAENQLNNIKGWEKTGFIEYAGSYDQRGLLDKINHSILRLFPYRERKRRSGIGRKAVDAKGTQRTITALMNNGKEKIKLCPAEKDDCMDIFRWRNHPEVRKWCFNPSKISLKKHKKWFLACLDNPKVKIFIASLRGQKIGVIRFNEEESGLIVSVNLNPKFFNMSLGTELIKLGTKRVLEESKTPKPIIAEIKSDNYISQKAFQKCGYTLSSRFKQDKGRAIYEKRI